MRFIDTIITIDKDGEVLKLWLKEDYVRQLHDNRAHIEAYLNPSQLTKSDLSLDFCCLQYC